MSVKKCTLHRPNSITKAMGGLFKYNRNRAVKLHSVAISEFPKWQTFHLQKIKYI